MTTPTQTKGIFAFAILQNRIKLIDNLNKNGYSIPLNISNQQLVDKLYGIYINEGFDKITLLLEGVSILPENMNSAITLRNSLTPVDKLSSVSAQKTFLESMQELWAGAKDVIGGSKETKQEPAVSPAVAAIVLLILAAIIGVIVWKF